MAIRAPISWKTSDKKWMATRRLEWEKVLLRLPGFRDLNREDWKYVEEYFFNGSPLPYTLPMTSKFLEWWLHPHGAYPRKYKNVRMLRSIWSGTVSDLRNVVYKNGGDREYGLMGGREQKIMLLLNQGWDPRIKIDFGDGRLNAPGYRPSQIFQNWALSLHSELTSDVYIAHAPYLALYDLVLDMLEEFPHAAFLVNFEQALNAKGKPILHKSMEANVLNSFKLLITFFDRDPEDPARLRPNTVRFVKKMVKRYEKREYPDAMLYLWDEAAQRIEVDQRKLRAKKRKQKRC